MGTLGYAEFLRRKSKLDQPSGFDPGNALNPKMFDFQRAVTRWACRRGRAAVWSGCGTGKSLIALEWSRLVIEQTGAPGLILTPLAVAEQFREEGAKFGISVRVVKDQSEIGPGINVTNYERLHRFDASSFGSVVLDESSCVKDYTSATRNMLIEKFSSTPYRLAATATPAPNDHVELGNHAEFLGALTRSEMLSTFFVHDGGETQTWRLKKHATKDFWRWVCSWAVILRSPADIGFDATGYDLPPLNIHDVIVPNDESYAAMSGSLFSVQAQTLDEQRAARRSSLPARVAAAAEIVSRDPDEPWLIWCDLNAEGEALRSAIPGAIEVRGSDDPDEKAKRLHAFRNGGIQILVTKPSIAAHGLNIQRCARVIFVGLSHSWEQWYQAIRRTYRFGQARPVECYMISSEAEGAVAKNLRRKHEAAESMIGSMLEEMGDIEREELSGLHREVLAYKPSKRMEIPCWLTSEATA